MDVFLLDVGTLVIPIGLKHLNVQHLNILKSFKLFIIGTRQALQHGLLPVI